MYERRSFGLRSCSAQTTREKEKKKEERRKEREKQNNRASSPLVLPLQGLLCESSAPSNSNNNNVSNLESAYLSLK